MRSLPGSPRKRKKNRKLVGAIEAFIRISPGTRVPPEAEAEDEAKDEVKAEVKDEAKVEAENDAPAAITLKITVRSPNAVTATRPGIQSTIVG